MGLAALVLALSVIADTHAQAAERAIFLMMGQSNAAGFGTEPPPVYQRADRISVYRNSGEWTPGAEPVDESEGQVDAVSRDAKSGVGLGMAFADRYAELHPGLEVGLVPCAKGGSTLAQWAPHWSRESLYGSCLARALEARRSGRIAGILWWQGEDSALDKRDNLGKVTRAGEAERWGVTFAAMVRALRVDLGDLNLPVVYARIRGHTPATKVVRQQQEGIASGPASLVSTDGIEYPDAWHPNTDGYQVVGRRMAEALSEVGHE